jgi:Heterokaryon incompatibility protein (HET)
MESKTLDQSNLEQLNSSAGEKIYTPIRNNEIRLVTIHSAEDGPVHCSFTIASREKPPPYSALSYEWGDKHDPETITLCRQTYYVTKNLHRALLKLRKSDDDATTLWIDALSINQSDNAERNVQVGAMRTIYSNATKTLIWLGEGDQAIEAVFQIASEFNGEEERLKEYTSESSLEECWKFLDGMSRLKLLGYWERLWIIQEILYSRDLKILYGLYAISSRLIIEFWEKALRQVERSEFYRTDSTVLLTCIFVRHMPLADANGLLHPSAALNGMYTSIESWIKRVPGLGCSDPRDKVYGFHGCFPPEIRERIVIDYTKSELDVFRDFTKTIIDISGNLKILHSIEAYNPWTSGRPSWVPRYSAWNKFDCLLYDPRSHISFESGPSYQLDEENSILQLKGIYLGNACNIAITQPLEIDAEPNTATTEAVLEHARISGQSLNVIEKDLSGFVNTFMDRLDPYDEIVSLIRQSLSLPTVMSLEDMRRAVGLNGELDNQYIDITLWAAGVNHRNSVMFALEDTPLNDTSRVFGLGRSGIKLGDELWFVVGCEHPLVLRRCEGGHVLVGSSLIPRLCTGGKLTEDVQGATNSSAIKDIYLH